MPFGFFKRNFWLIILILIIGGYFLFFQDVPCQSAIQYKIGTFDNRFGISQKDFLNVVFRASKIWENPINKNLFEYNSKGNLTINLIYDNRQKVTQENAVLKADINKVKNLANSVREQYLSLQEQFQIIEKEYKDYLDQFKQHLSAYNSQVDHWNSMGGAPKSEHNKLNQEKSNLATEQIALENKRLELNSLVDNINQFINKYNLLIKDANSNINTINQTADREFEEGIYDPNKNVIDIYQFENEQKLTRVLAHELGHTLGLDHNNNPKSIMYSLNQAENETLSKDDLLALKTKCNLLKN